MKRLVWKRDGSSDDKSAAWCCAGRAGAEEGKALGASAALIQPTCCANRLRGWCRSLVGNAKAFSELQQAPGVADEAVTYWVVDDVEGDF